MKSNLLIPYNNQIIPTKTLKDLGLNTNDINKLLDEKILKRVKRGYYEVTIIIESDVKTMKYYLMNNLLDDFLVYFDSLFIKDYNAYYYRLMYDILVCDYTSAYQSLIECCKLNKEPKNKINLYTFLLLIDELINISSDNLVQLKNKIFNSDLKLELFLECIIRKDYENACSSLKETKSISKLELSVLRSLSIKASEVYSKKNSKEMTEYNNLYDYFYQSVISNDYDAAYYYFVRLYNLCKDLNIEDSRLEIYNDLFNCFNYILEHQELDLESYKTNYKYPKDLLEAFYQALKRNDYVNAYIFISTYDYKNGKELEIYQILLQRIYNFLNIRSVIKKHNPNRKISLNSLIKEKRYVEAMEEVRKKEDMDVVDKNIVTSILESIIALDDIKIEG